MIFIHPDGKAYNKSKEVIEGAFACWIIWQDNTYSPRIGNTSAVCSAPSLRAERLHELEISNQWAARYRMLNRVL